MKRPIAAIAVVIAMGACGVDDDPEVSSSPSSKEPSATTQAATEASLPDVENAVAQMLAEDPTLCGTELDAFYSELDATFGGGYDRDIVAEFVQTACADYMPEPSQPPAPEYPTFGETYSWDDGLAATVTTPEVFTPSEGNDVAGITTYVRFTITLTNNTGAEFDSTLASESVQSGGREAEFLIDSANGLVGSPTVTVLPNRSVSYDVGYGVLDPADLIVELSPSFEHSGAIFVGSAG